MVAKSTMHPLSSNVQWREDLKQKGNLPHPGNHFTSPVPTRNLTKGCYSAVNFEVTPKSIPVGHPLESRAHITLTILTLSSRLATSSLCWKKFDACWCDDLIISATNMIYLLTRIIKKRAYIVWRLRLWIDERRTQGEEFLLSDIGVKIRHGFLQARHQSDGKVVCCLILISLDFLEDNHSRKESSKVTETAWESVKILVIRHYSTILPG